MTHSDETKSTLVVGYALMILRGTDDRHAGVPELDEVREWRAVDGTECDTLIDGQAMRAGRAIVDGVLDWNRDLMPVLKLITQYRRDRTDPAIWFRRYLDALLQGKPEGLEWLKDDLKTTAWILGIYHDPQITETKPMQNGD